MSGFEGDEVASKVSRVMEKIKPYLKDGDGSTYNRVFEAIYEALNV